MSRISLTFKVPPKAVEDILFAELSKLLQRFANATYKQVPSLTYKFKELTRDIFRQGAMNQGLVVDGDLAGAFGIPAGDIVDTADKIIDIIVDNLFINVETFKADGRMISTKMRIELSPKVYTDLLNSNFAEITTKKGVILPWIEWSLFKGDQIIIDDYEVFFHVGSGRSGLAVMKKNSSSFWKVPSEVSGTENDNWITREIKKQRESYLALTQQSLTEILDSVL